MDLYMSIDKILDWMTEIINFLKYDITFKIVGYNLYVSFFDILIFMMIFYVLVKYILFRH